MATTGDDERTVEDILQEASTTLDKSVAVTERIKASLNETRTTAAETMRDLDEQEEQLRRIGRETRFVGATIKEAHRDANKLGFFKGLFSGLRTTKSRKARNKAVSSVVESASTSSASLAGKSAAGAADDADAPPPSAFDGAPVRLEHATDDQREDQLADNLDDIEHTLRDLRAQALTISDTLERQNRTITDVTVRATLSVEDARHLNRRLGV